MRFAFAVPLAAIVGFIGLVALSWTGWGTETVPSTNSDATRLGSSSSPPLARPLAG